MQIKKLTREIRNKSLKKVKKRSPEELSTSWYQEDLLYQGRGPTLFMILPTGGCSWALSESGGCTMCSYINDSHVENVPARDIIPLFHEIMDKHTLEEPTAVKIFTSGSFLNPDEMPVEARREILQTLGEIENVAEVVVESRPEYVNREIIKECCSYLPDKIFEISMGLESASDHTREYKINKGFSKKDFEQAVEIIKDLKSEYKVRSKAYILVKPILTSEKQGIQEAIDSAIYAEKAGIDRISFCPATIHKGTLIEELWRKGSYQPPWIWSTIKIINQVREKVNIPAIMDTSGFGSRRGPYNCKKCNSKLKQMIIDSNLDQIPVKELECDCKNQWQVESSFCDIGRSTTRIRY
ncbi:archaeosine biosynthesis radical SAM protein RaSEA [Methanobacterium alkalithermotolerans]|uniref:Archaeosine biosynthesis radical SAM protein RaSEA n=1 Tax=Methanobacterium alkalithermotolerans TaxID=2731220 RepID=A0A8T8K6S2_9EURY|nr:archaeosine biosynthesis radical SAM protein RaSEA [Methanobacterium alkalithermotolerans]QUH23727.1 archaeosine biosynthesis radical SAM protein RaSEA [Methanobacterium alkalithermotolerans]